MEGEKGAEKGVAVSQRSKALPGQPTNQSRRPLLFLPFSCQYSPYFAPISNLLPTAPSPSPNSQMAFLGQLQSKLQGIKTQAMPQVNAVLEQANQATTKARQNLMPVLNKCSQQLDTLGKILQANVSPKQSPIDLVPAITAFDPTLENAVFKWENGTIVIS